MDMKKTMNRIDWWNLFFILFFLVELYMVYRALALTGSIPTSITLWETVILALASFRLTRLVVYDAITRWFRDFFANGEEYTFVGTVNTLINCPWCVGLWCAFFVSSLYFLFPEAWFFIFIVALGGIATLVQLIANLVGWSAEYKKRLVQGITPKEGEHKGGTCG